MKYDFQAIESRWQAYWAEHRTFAAPNPGDPPEAGFDPGRPKFYVLDMFPYPSGVGLHVGHPLGYIATDIVARFQRMQGKNVLHPMGFDAFGLPAEQYAIETGVHPRETTEKNIANMRRQLQRLGLSYDWDRELATTDADYYRWTQWIFLQLYQSWYDPRAHDGKGAARPIQQLIDGLHGEDYLVDINGGVVWSGDAENLDALGGTPVGLYKFHELDAQQQQRLIDEHRLAYLDEVPVNWCPALGTVLANEEVTADGRSERGNHTVEKRPLRQWMLRITRYADRLADELDQVDWPDPIKLLQRNWVGRSTGAEVDFALASNEPRPSGSGGQPKTNAQTPDETPRNPLPHGRGSSDIPETDTLLTVFTTRPDTLFGATYMVLAPEHPLVMEIATDEQRQAVDDYRRQAARKSEIDRQAESKEKTGVFTGAYAVNPVNGERIPIWIADYVMMGYGTSAIMAVPAHDERDFAFANKFDLPIREVVSGGDIEQAAHTGSGELVNSANDDVSLNGKPVEEAKRLITDWLEEQGLGRAKVQYKLRDWLFSRQRYWGEPFPILHELDDQGRRTGVIRPVPEDQLPVELPEMPDFKQIAPAASDPVTERSSDRDQAGDSIAGSLDHSIASAQPQPPLSKAPDDWKYVELDGKRYEREFNTMPQWAGSCWYYLRFCDPRNRERLVGREAEGYWMGGAESDRAIKRSSDQNKQEGSPSIARSLDHSITPTPRSGVDLYVGGAEHAVLHLLYARFWHKVLYDLGHVSTPEPFGKLFNQGYIQAYAYTDDRGVYVPAEEVVEKEGRFYHGDTEVTREFGKMGKSLKNAVGPDEIAEQYGCDTLRLYEMYLGPLEQSKVWNTQDIVGVHRFLNRLWRNLVPPEDADTGELRVADTPPDPELARLTHKTIARVSASMSSMGFNVAIAAMIELNNALVPLDRVPRWVAEQLVLMLSPLAPHVCEELWSKLGHAGTIAYEPWPTYDADMLEEDEVELPVQVLGKLRGRITVPRDADEAAIVAAAKAEPNVAQHLAGKTIHKTIVVPGKLVNLVAK